MSNKKIGVFILVVLSVILLGESGYTQPPRSNNTDAYLINNLGGARSLIQSGEYDRALNLLMSLKKTYGGLYEINFEIKNAYRLKKDYGSLKEILLKEKTATLDSFELYCQLGEVYFLTDSLILAKTYWDKALLIAGENDYRYLLLANYYRNYGFYDEAALVYKRGRVALKRPDLFRDELLDIYISQKNYGDAIGEYIGQMKSQPDRSAEIADEIVRLTDQADSSGVIIKQIERSLSADSKNPDLYCLLGALQLKNNDLKQAFENYKKGDKLSGNKGRYIYNFAVSCFNTNKFEMAIEATDYFCNNIDDKLRSQQMQLLKAKCLGELGSIQPALDLLNSIKISSIDPKIKAEALMTEAYINEQKLGNPQAARTAYTQIVDDKVLNGTAPKAKLNLAEINLKLGDYNKASELLGQVAANEQYRDLSERAMFLTGEMAFFKLDFDGAIKIYKGLTAKYSNGIYVNDCLDRLAMLETAKGDSSVIYAANAYQLRYSGQADSAVIFMEKAASVNGSPAASYMLFNLGNFYEHIKNWPKAAETYERYNETYKDGLYIDRSIFELAIIYYENLAQPDKANALFNKLMTEFPASPLIEKARAYLNKIKAS